VRVAVTFCNQRSTPRLSICIVDLETAERQWLRVPDGFDAGAAGIAAVDGALFVAAQPGGIVRYGCDLEPTGLLPTPSARNLHSISYRPGERALYVTSAHNDTLFRYELDDLGAGFKGEEAVYDADPSHRGQDRFHLNSVAEWRGDLYATLFGPSTGENHKSRRNGKVVRIADGKTIADGLYHPHSLYVHDDELYVVESQAQSVHRITGAEPRTWSIPGGYPRGLATLSPQRLLVGVSALRRESNSLGTQNVFDSNTPLDFRTRLVELDLESGAVCRSVDLTLLAGEIFDVRVLPPGAPFEPSPDGGLAERVEALEESFRELRASRRRVEQEMERTPMHRLRRLSSRVARRIRAAWR
jgi:hypothetical protein